MLGWREGREVKEPNPSQNNSSMKRGEENKKHKEMGAGKNELTGEGGGDRVRA